MSDLHAELLEAHQNKDSAALVRLYKTAGEAALANDETQGCFYLTHAYVFALEAGLPEAEELRKVLASYGRED